MSDNTGETVQELCARVYREVLFMPPDTTTPEMCARVWRDGIPDMGVLTALLAFETSGTPRAARRLANALQNSRGPRRPRCRRALPHEDHGGKAAAPTNLLTAPTGS